MDELVNDLKRACTATSYTYLYSLQILRALESKARKELQELEGDSDDPSAIRLRRAVRKWEVFCQVLENSMVDPAAAATAGSSTVFHKRRLDVALTINELTQRQRKRQRPGDDEDADNGMNGHADRNQSALETALLRFLRRYALGVQVDDSLLDPLLPSGLDTVHAGKQIGALLMKHSLSVRALLGYLYKPGSSRVTAPVVKNKCARLIALAVRAAEEVAWAESRAPNVKGGEDGELGDDDGDGEANSRELSDEVALTRVILQGGQLCEQLESMVSFLVSVDKGQKNNNGSGIPSGPGQKLCALAFQHAPVAQGVMIWAREFTHGNEFATSASFPTLSVSILSLARLVGIYQPFARGDALSIALQFLKHTNRDVSYQKMNAIKEQSLRLLIHLLMQGELAAVLNAITSRLQQQSSSELDASLIRYFVAGVLEAVRPPVSSAFVRLFAQLLLAPLCIDAVRSTYFQSEHRARLVQLVLAFPMVRTLNGNKLEGEDLAIVNALMATYQIKSE
jgi:TH1 protein